MTQTDINSKLPPETVDRIIDHLFDDKPSLAACSLVCKQWEPAARFHLFHTITIVYKTFDDLNIIVTERRFDQAEHVLSYTKEYRIDFATNQFTLIDLWPMLPFMPNVHTLCLSALINALEDIAIANPKSESFAIFPNIHTLKLELYSVLSLTPYLLHVIFHMFPNLRNFLMFMPYFTAGTTINDDFDSVVIPQTLRLTFVKFDKPSITPRKFLQVLSSTPTAHSLTSLDLGCLFGTDRYMAFKDVAPEMKKNLQTLRLGLCDPSGLNITTASPLDIDTTRQELALHEFSSLHTFNVIVPDPRSNNIDAHRINIQLIGWIHPDITTIVMEFGSFYKVTAIPSSFPSETWTELAGLIPHFKKLKSLRILRVEDAGANSGPLDDELQVEVSKALPNISSKGLLQF
ncbi:hypothetical protein QCA50_005649 [Cerrena zonata]|uniref:F-box domain-containing protein n=1 Tax=Cerrena zonata TaxID=2478898 RepID=A0AAW0GCA9_9APHY